MADWRAMAREALLLDGKIEAAECALIRKHLWMDGKIDREEFGFLNTLRKAEVVKASFPEHDWRTEGRVKNYWDMPTLNDGVAGAVADALLEARAVYGEKRIADALARLGDFLILAQLPEPQPGWAQQYDLKMRPIWARVFEPAAVAGRESQDAIETLLKIAAATGDRKYLAPIPAALDWLQRSTLPDGRLARYYELRTNKPLYMKRLGGKRYELTYDDSDLPGHYGWKTDSRVAGLRRRYEQQAAGRPAPQSRPDRAALAAKAEEAIRALDDQGRWVSVFAGEALVGQPKFPAGYRYLSSAVFARNVGVLSDFLRAP